MKKLFFLLAASASLMTGGTALAQQRRKCGNTRIEALYGADPARAALRDAQRATALLAGGAGTPGTAAKGAAVVTIPVAFHVVLTQTQLDKIGGAAGVAARCISQIDALNADYAGKNADSVNIAGPFKSLHAKTNIQFGLAHTDPAGHGTPGFEIKITTANGFDENTSSFGGEVKHAASGGLDSWDVTKYLNIWVENFLDGTSVSYTLGLTTSPQFVSDYSAQFSADEAGVMVTYGAFGVRTGAVTVTNYYTYLSPGSYADRGRTLTHEVGHFFDMVHIWGDDGPNTNYPNGLCPNDGGHDDGVADTPPQATENYGGPAFPHITCNNGPNGDMFMNYMDYVDDTAMHLFSPQQAAIMNGHVTPGKISYSLTQHPALLEYPLAVTDIESKNPFTVSPNPATSNVFISFNAKPEGLRSIDIINTLGQHVSATTATAQAGYNIDLSSIAKGIYYVQCRFDAGTVTRKIVLQ